MWSGSKGEGLCFFLQQDPRSRHEEDVGPDVRVVGGGGSGCGVGWGRTGGGGNHWRSDAAQMAIGGAEFCAGVHECDWGQQHDLRVGDEHQPDSVCVRGVHEHWPVQLLPHCPLQRNELERHGGGRDQGGQRQLRGGEFERDRLRGRLFHEHRRCLYIGRQAQWRWRNEHQGGSEMDGDPVGADGRWNSGRKGPVFLEERQRLCEHDSGGHERQGVCGRLFHQHQLPLPHAVYCPV